jgi:hypothetical protein
VAGCRPCIDCKCRRHLLRQSISCLRKIGLRSIDHGEYYVPSAPGLSHLSPRCRLRGRAWRSGLQGRRGGAKIFILMSRLMLLGYYSLRFMDQGDTIAAAKGKLSSSAAWDYKLLSRINSISCR